MKEINDVVTYENKNQLPLGKKHVISNEIKDSSKENINSKPNIKEENTNLNNQNEENQKKKKKIMLIFICIGILIVLAIILSVVFTKKK